MSFIYSQALSISCSYTIAEWVRKCFWFFVAILNVLCYYSPTRYLCPLLLFYFDLGLNTADPPLPSPHVKIESTSSFQNFSFIESESNYQTRMVNTVLAYQEVIVVFLKTRIIWFVMVQRRSCRFLCTKAHFV